MTERKRSMMGRYGTEGLAMENGAITTQHCTVASQRTKVDVEQQPMSRHDAACELVSPRCPLAYPVHYQNTRSPAGVSCA